MNYAGKFGSGGLGPDSGGDIGSGPLSQPGHFSSSGNFHVDKVSTHAPSDAIIISDAHLLFHGDFKRSGVDLVLSSGDREVVLHEYFKGEKRAALASPDGAHLTGDLVNALSGHTQFAQADGSASVAPAIIGHVTKLTGNATAIRNGVSIILNQGDTVHKGDVVQSGSDSTLGITFIDGTVFGLASNAKMVLNEMIYDPNGSDNKSLLSLVQGTISFVAGATAKKGDMKVDTPVATMGIRGTAVLVEIDFEVPSQGGAPPARFQVLVEPDGTTGSYILFDKTTLTPIATVNQAGTQTIINGQGAVSFVSSAQLSPDAQRVISDVFSLKFTDLNNPNTKLTNNSNGSIDPQTVFLKLASNDFIPVTLQFVNVPDKLAPSPGTAPILRLEHIPGPPDAAASGGSFTERVDVTGSTAVDSISGKVSYADINPGDVPTVKAAFSSFVYANAQNVDVTTTLTAEQLAAIKAVEVPLSVVQDPNGKNTGQATWTYTIADGAFDFLAAGETLTLTYIARVDNNYAPSNETTFVPFTIVITGTNDKPTVSTSGVSVVELIGSGNTEFDTVSGTVTFTDADLTDRPIVSAALSSTQPFKYLDADGHDITATLTPQQLAAIAAVKAPLSVVQDPGNTHNGTATWTYSVLDSAFDFIADDETLILNYVIQVDDGHGGIISTPVTVSINGADVSVTGTNDVPVIVDDSTTAADSVTEDEAATLAVGGTITFQDLDLTDTHTATFVLKSSNANANLPGYSEAAPLSQIGAFSLTAVSENPGVTNVGSIGWSFALNNSDPVLQSLAVGQTITQVYTVTFNDHHGGTVTQDVTVTITGTNDAPTIVAETTTASGGVTEDFDVDADEIETSGTIAIQDLDLIDTHTATWEFKASASNEHLPGFDEGNTHIGTFTIDTSVTESISDTNDGATLGWSFTLENNDAMLQSLALGQTITQIYTVTFDDHHGGTVARDVTVTITGTNDAPTVTASNGAITEMAGTGNTALDHAGGSISFADLDLSDRPIVSASFSGYAYKAANGTSNLSLTAQQQHDLGVALTLTPAGGNTNNGSVSWSYDVADSQFDFLADNETLTLTYTATVDDDHGGLVTKPVTVTITGSNDTPTLAAELAGNVTDTAANDGFGNITGVLDGSDADHGETATLSYRVVDAEGHATNEPVAGAFGSLTVNAGGTYTYVPDAAAINALHEGNYTDTFTVRTTDVHGAVGTAILTVNVQGANDTPSIVGEVNPPAQIVVVTSTHVLAAGVNVSSLGVSTETFDGQTAGSSSNNGAGRGNFHSNALSADFMASGNAGVVIGSSPSVTAAPFVGPLPGNQDTTKYLSIGANATETITFASEKNVFGLYWGSVDSYNTIKFYDGTTLVASYTGADINPLLSTGNQGSFASNGYVEFQGLHSFNKVVLGSTSNAFEIDNISAGYVPPLKTVTGTLNVHDADIGDTLTAFVTGNATIEYNGSTTMPGGIDVSALLDAGGVTFDTMLSNGGTAVLQWTYHPTDANLNFLHAGDVLKIKFIAEVSDGHGHIGSQPLTVTLVGAANASTAAAAGPVIGTEAFTITELGNGVTKISGLHVTDADATAPTDTFTVSAATGNVGSSVNPSAGSGAGIAGLNAALDNGIVYDAPSPQPQTDSVTLTVADSFGHTDRVHFIFNQGGSGPDVTLTGTSGKDVIFATGSDDTLTGGASADQFVFAPGQNPSADTITDFTPGQDRIDLRLFSEVGADNINGWLSTHAAQSSTNPADVLITLGNEAITLKNVAVTSLHVSDFIVSPHHVT